MKQISLDSYEALINQVHTMLSEAHSEEDIMNACGINRKYLQNLTKLWVQEGHQIGEGIKEVAKAPADFLVCSPLKSEVEQKYGPEAAALDRDVEADQLLNRLAASIPPNLIHFDAMTSLPMLSRTVLAECRKQLKEKGFKELSELPVQKLTDDLVERRGLILDRQVRAANAVGLKPKEKAAPAQVTEAYWRKEYFAMKAKHDQLLHADVSLARICEAVKEGNPKAYDTAPYVGITRDNSDTSPQTAVLLVSDTHVGKHAYADQTLGFGHYDIPTYLDRLQLLEDTVISILTSHVSCVVPELHVLMLGDMVDGNLQHGSELDQLHSLQEQWNVAAHSLAQMLRNLKRYFPRVIVTPVVGNHGRWASQRRVPTKFKNSSLDGVVYDLCAALTADIPGLTWNIDQDPSKIVDINGSIFFISHGDNLQGGDRALGIPSHAIARQVTSLSQNLVREGRPVPHYYCFGHFHREMTLPHPNGKIFVNGGFPGSDEFAMTQNFPGAPPEQKLLLIHPKYRMTANWPIYLEHAKAGSSRYRMEGIIK